MKRMYPSKKMRININDVHSAIYTPISWNRDTTSQRLVAHTQT